MQFHQKLKICRCYTEWVCLYLSLMGILYMDAPLYQIPTIWILVGIFTQDLLSLQRFQNFYPFTLGNRYFQFLYLGVPIMQILGLSSSWWLHMVAQKATMPPDLTTHLHPMVESCGGMVSTAKHMAGGTMWYHCNLRSSK